MNKIILLHFILLVIFFIACEDKTDNINPGITLGESEVVMAFTAPSISSSQVLVDDEKVIELDLVVCKDGLYQYTRKAYSSQYATFRSTLKIQENVDIYFFANCRSVLTNTDIFNQGVSWDEIQSKLLIQYTDTIIEGQAVLPMWGQLKGVDISDDNINNLGTISLLRAVAAANIYFNLNPAEDKDKAFTPVVAYIYYGADRAFIAPAEDNLIFSGGMVSDVKEPVAPDAMKTVRKTEVQAVDGEFDGLLYMFDNPVKESSSQRRRTRLVVGGIYDGQGETYYYPLDFSHTQSNEILRVTRNNRYNIFITAVRGEGYLTPDEAAENAAVNLDYEVIDWREIDDENIIVDGPNYLSVSTKKAVLLHKAGSTYKIGLSGTFYKDDFSLLFTNSLNGTSITTNGVTKNDHFSAQLTGEGTNLVLTVTALSDFSSSDSRLNFDSIQLRAGRIVFDIEVEQKDAKGWDNGGNEDIEF